jgi:hypothetical protein
MTITPTLVRSKFTFCANARFCSSNRAPASSHEGITQLAETPGRRYSAKTLPCRSYKNPATMCFSLCNALNISPADLESWNIKAAAVFAPSVSASVVSSLTIAAR